MSDDEAARGDRTMMDEGEAMPPETEGQTRGRRVKSERQVLF